MDEETMATTITSWVSFARKQRHSAREYKKCFEHSDTAKECMGVARGIMLVCRAIKGYDTKASFFNQYRRVA